MVRQFNDSSGDVMGKFIVVSFLALGFAFYELSGGADFVPEERIIVAEAEVADEKPAIQTSDIQVTRSNAATLTALNPTVTTVSLDTAPASEPEIAAAEPEVVVIAEPIIVEEPVVEVVEIVEVASEPLDIRAVAGTRVNMRQGPGTTFDVLDTLDGGTQAKILEVNSDGWAHIQILNTGQTGWMAERLLSDG